MAEKSMKEELLEILYLVRVGRYHAPPNALEALECRKIINDIREHLGELNPDPLRYVDLTPMLDAYMKARGLTM